MAILTDGIDLAKNVFTVHGVNEAGRPALRLPYGILRHLTNEGGLPRPEPAAWRRTATGATMGLRISSTHLELELLGLQRLTV